MPRNSEKQNLIEKLLKYHDIAQYAVSSRDREVLEVAISVLLSSRYLQRPGSYRINHYPDRENWIGSALSRRAFKFHFRMGEESFEALLSRISGHQLMTENYLGRRTVHSPRIQLSSYLKSVGFHGNSASSLAIATFLNISVGSIHRYRQKIRDVILDLLKSSSLTWPDSDERDLIARQIKRKYKLKGCVGAVDGTLFPFGSKPNIKNAEDYFDRKSNYSLNAIIINDQKKRIRYVFLGWPGSIHDDRSISTSALLRNPDDFFGYRQYLVGDSAFSPRRTLISVFKKPRGGALTEDQETFNKILSKFRVTSEHAIGMSLFFLII